MASLKAPVTGAAAGKAAEKAGGAAEQSDLYKSAVRLTRLYATFSPTMVALLLAKKTKYGRFIPLPDALPDGFKLGKWTFDRKASETETAAAEEAPAPAANGSKPKVVKSGSAPKAAQVKNGSAPKATQPAIPAAPHGANGSAQPAAQAKNGSAPKAAPAGSPAVNGSAPKAAQPAAPAPPPVRIGSTPKAAQPAALAAPSKNGAAAARPAVQRLVEYEVVHQVPGRVRFGIPRLAHDGEFAQRLAEGVMALPLVTRARTSATSRSLVVEYRRYTVGSRPSEAMLPQLVECIRVAAGADLAWDLAAPKPRTSEAAGLKPEPVLLAKARSLVALDDLRSHSAFTAERPAVIRPLTLPALSLGLSAGVAAGLSLPAWLMGGLVLLAAKPIFGRALEGIRSEKRLTVEFLDSATIVLMVSQASFLAPSIIVSVIESAQVARDWTARRRPQVSLAQMMPPEQRTQIVGPGQQAPRAWNEIEPGDELLLYSGDPIPADGLVLEGAGLVDQRRVAGDALPVVRQAGDQVYAGSVLIDGHLRVLAQRTGHDTAVGRAVALLQAGPAVDTRHSNYARKVGNWAVVPTLLVGGAVFAASGSVVRATGIVNLDLGTGMRVSAPIAIFVAQSRAARQGIQIRSGRAVEMLAAADTVVLDRAAAPGEAREAVERLQALGLEVRLLGCDPLEAVQPTASNQASQRKLEALQALQAAGRTVALVGHGVVDVAAMAHADVSIALASAGDLAQEAADIVLLNDDLRDLAAAVELARHTVRLLHQDMRLVTATNVGAIGYGALAALGPVAPMLINNGSWALATLNSLRPFKATPGAPTSYSNALDRPKQALRQSNSPSRK